MSTDKHSRLVAKAYKLKKAWVMATAILGITGKLKGEELIIPNYHSFDNVWLKKYTEDLEDDFEALAKEMLLDAKRSHLPEIASWLADRFDSWRTANSGLFLLGRVHEVEKAIGKLGHRRTLDCPPYAEVLLQGGLGAGIRHPEYHLATDLALLYNLFLDSEAILDRGLSENKVHCTEHSQSLGRSVILTCFNLLESFVTGLAVGWLIDNPNGPTATIGKLQDTKKPLRKRFVDFPSLITGGAVLIDASKPPIEPLFNKCKQRRDSFVHCEPGPIPSERGYVKEERFHDVDANAVRETVDLTVSAICLVWKAVHGTEQPRWLAKRDEGGRFCKVRVRLTPIDECVAQG
jgi:hypothetical protein